MSANALVLTFASFGAGVLTDRAGAPLVWALASVATVLAGLVGWLLARTLSRFGKQAVVAVSLKPYAEPPINL